MKVRDLAATLLTVTLTLGVSQAVQADPDRRGPPDPELDCSLPVRHAVISLTDHICIEELLEVFNTIGDASPDNINLRDQSRLQSKVCAADDKLEVMPTPDRKFDDAVKKLNEVISTVVTKPKIVDDGGKIKEAAECAIYCINTRDTADCPSSPDP
jgi:hypothetical protein